MDGNLEPYIYTSEKNLGLNRHGEAHVFRGNEGLNRDEKLIYSEKMRDLDRDGEKKLQGELIEEEEQIVIFW